MEATMATKWGCLGPGRIASDFFLAIQDNLPQSEHQFVAVASRDINRSQAFADKFKFQRAYGSYDEVAQDPDVEVVYIATINSKHAELSIKMLEAGKHVLCEKPMAINSKQVQRVHQVAKEKRKLFVEAVWSRWFPIYTQIQNDLSCGSLGDINLVQANFCVPLAKVYKINKLELGGGGLLDIGIYVVQFACFVFGEMPESITAVGNLLNGMDQSACITLKYKNGGMACLVYHTNIPNDVRNGLIVGTKGMIEIEAPFNCPTIATTPSGRYEFPLKENDYLYGNSAGLHYEAAAVRECLLNGWLEAPKFKHSESEMIHQIMDEIRKQLNVIYPDID